MENFSFSDVGSITSILAFFITLIILFNIRRIKNFYIFKIRIPELSKKLKIIVSNISDFSNDYESSVYSIDVEVAKCEVFLKSLKRKLPHSTKKSAKDLIKKLNDYQSTPNKKTEDNLRSIYVSVLKIIEEIKTIEEDYKWER